MLKKYYPIYKWLIYIPGLGLVTFVNFLGVLVVAPFSPRKASRWFAGMWARTLLRMVPAKLEAIGGHSVDPARSYVIVANHQSLFDIPVLYGWLKLDLKWVMKKELRKVPLIGWGCALMGHIFLDRSNRQASILQLKQVKEELLPGTSILFFPEGSRSRDGKIKPFKAGAFIMAKDLELPVLPITVKNTDTILPPGGMNLSPGSAQMIIHPPIDVDQVRRASPDQLRDKARQIIAAPLED